MSIPASRLIRRPKELIVYAMRKLNGAASTSSEPAGRRENAAMTAGKSCRRTLVAEDDRLCRRVLD